VSLRILLICPLLWKPAAINPATIYITFRVSRKRQIKARLAANGHSIGKSRNAELALS